jgi:hypothetical protein
MDGMLIGCGKEVKYVQEYEVRKLAFANRTVI